MNCIECPERNCVKNLATRIRDTGDNVIVYLELAGLGKGAEKMYRLLNDEGPLARDLTSAIQTGRTARSPYDQFTLDFQDVEELRLSEDTIQDCEKRISGICLYFIEGVGFFGRDAVLSEVLSSNNPLVKEIKHHPTSVRFSMSHSHCPYMADIRANELPLVGVNCIKSVTFRHDPPRGLVPGVNYRYKKA